MKAWTKFLPNVMLELPKCPRVIALQAIRDTAIDFCEQTKIWQEIQAPYPVGGGIFDYEFFSDTGVVVYEVQAAELENGQKLFIRTAGFTDGEFPKWRQGTVRGAPQILTQLNPEKFILVPVPVTATTVTITAALKPTRDSTRGPDFLFNDHYEGICFGAKARLMMQKDQPWSDMEMAKVNAVLYAAESTKANIRRSKAFGRGVTRVEGQYF